MDRGQLYFDPFGALPAAGRHSNIRRRGLGHHFVHEFFVKVARLTGLEPATPGVTGRSAAETAIIIMGGIMVLAAECMNTAIERVVDDIGMERRDLAKQAKDAGSAAVAVTAISVGAAWATILCMNFL